MPRESAVVAVDLGTSKVCIAVAEALADGRTAILGIGLAPANGMAKGVVVDLDAAAESVARALARAERNSGYRILSAYVGISGAHLYSTNNRGVVAIAQTQPEVTARDVALALDAARSVPLPAHDEVLHLAPRTYILDGQAGVADPVGMVGRRLEVEAHVVSGAATAVRNVTRTVERANIALDDLVPEPLAAGTATLTPAEREMGVALVDIGAGTTDIAVYLEDAIAHTAVLPLGGNHLTNDLSIVLQVPFESAEQLKLAHGRATPFADDEEELTVEGFETAPRTVARRMAHEVIEARLEQLLQLVGKELRASGYDRQLPGGVVLTGGTALLPELASLTRDVLGLRARIGTPRKLAGLGDSLAGPDYATVVGLAQWGLARHEAPRVVRRLPARARRSGRQDGSWGGALTGWLRELLP